MRQIAIFSLLAISAAAFASDLAAVARQAQEAGQYDRAVGAWRELLGKQSDNPEVLSNLGVALFLQGKNDGEALDVLRRALKFNTGAVPANLFTGLSLTRMGQPSKALPYLRRAYAGDRLALRHTRISAGARCASRFSRGESLLLRNDAEDGRIAEAWYGLGITYRSLLKEAASQGEYSNVVDANASGLPSSGTQQPWQRAPGMGQCESVSYRRREAFALEALSKAVQLDPESDRAHLLLAEFHRDSGKLIEAVREYEAAIRIRPDLAAAYLGLAAAYWKTGETERVWEPLNRALSLAPEDPEANGILADLRVRTADYSGARRAAEKALGGNPQLAHVRAVLAKIYLAEGQTASAAKALESIADQDETGSWNYLLHRALKQLGRDADAEAALVRFRYIRERMGQQGRSIPPEP